MVVVVRLARLVAVVGEVTLDISHKDDDEDCDGSTRRHHHPTPMTGKSYSKDVYRLVQLARLSWSFAHNVIV
ncbi:hypothetical protein ACA910_016534 [Epithemia clementina (nom. ined.)]